MSALIITSAVFPFPIFLCVCCTFTHKSRMSQSGNFFSVTDAECRVLWSSSTSSRLICDRGLWKTVLPYSLASYDSGSDTAFSYLLDFFCTLLWGGETPCGMGCDL